MSLNQGCGHTRFATQVAAEKAASKGALGKPEECRRGGLLHWHLKVPAVALGFSARLRLLCRIRAGNGFVPDACCEACGCPLGLDGGVIQSRTASLPGCLSGLVLLCGAAALGTGCHGLCERRDARMNAIGFWLRHGQNPRTEPVMLHGRGGGGATVWLHEDEPRYMLTGPLLRAA